MATATPTSTTDFLDLLKKSRIWSDDELRAKLEALPKVSEDATKAAALLVKQGVLTPFQARVLLGGKHRGFRLGAYVIRDQIGLGGMGTVYLAQHETLRRPVAIKVLSPGDKADKGASSKVNVERFLREARSAAAPDHPNIVRIFDVAQLGDTHYLVMEYVDGQTLDQLVSAGGPVACGRAVEFILQAAAGLEHAYLKGFIHRDIKPGNLILARDGTVKILDMGLARSEETADKVTEVFDRGAVVGTADYISPEQAMNAPDLDIRADIYSLGATFYTLVTGKPPFTGNTTQKLMQHQIKEAPPLSALDKTFPPELALVVAKMMKKRPADRYQTPGEVMAALGPWLSNTSHVVSALSRTESRDSKELQQTLTEVVSGSTKRLPEVIAAAGAKPPRSLLPFVVAGVAGMAVGLVGLGALVAYAFSGSSDKNVASGQPQQQQQAGPVTPRRGSGAAITQPSPAGPAAPRTTVFAFTAEPLAPFRQQWRTTPNKANPDSLDTVVLGNSGAGKLPESWQRMNYKAGTVSEIAVDEVEGVKAIGFATLEGERSTMIFATPFAATQRGLRVKIEYLTEGAAGDGYLKFRQTMPESSANGWEVGTLPSTAGRWATREFPIDAKAATQGQLEFHTGWLELGKALWVKSFTVTSGGEAAGTSEQASGMPVVGKVLYRSKFEGLEPFQEKSTTAENYWRDLVMPKAGGMFEAALKNRLIKVTERTGRGNLPADCLLASWKPTTIQEARVGRPHGATAVGFRTAAGDVSTMLLLPEVAFVGPHVRVRIEHCVEGTTGECRIRFKQQRQGSDDGKVWDAATLPSAGGGWQMSDFELETGDSAGGYLEIHNTFVPAGETLWIKSVTIYEPTN